MKLKCISCEKSFPIKEYEKIFGTICSHCDKFQKIICCFICKTISDLAEYKGELMCQNCAKDGMIKDGSVQREMINHENLHCTSCNHIFDSIPESWKYCPYCGDDSQWK